MKWFKFVKTLVLDNETKYCTFKSSSKAETITHIVKLMMYLNQSTAQLYQANKNLLQKVQFVLLITVDLLINILKYELSKDSSYIKLPKELDHPKKGLIN